MVYGAKNSIFVAMKFKMPPPLVMLVFGVLMYIMAKILPFGEFDFFGRRPLKYALWGLGFVVMLVALVQFRIKKTTTNPLEPKKASQLVVSGIFSYSRNPMYLGMLLLLIGFGLQLGNAFNTITAAGFVYFMNHFQIKFEEEALTTLFGKDYTLYCKAVRRWF